MNESKNIGNKITILLSIFFISISLFVYQVVLTRLYSAVLSYHYVFLITSFAIYGLGIGSIFAYRLRDRNKKVSSKFGITKDSADQESMNRQISNGSIILSASFIISLTYIYLLPYASGAIIYTILGTIPFLIGGYLYSVLFTEFSEISGKLYFGDLVGSGAGSLAVIFLLDNIGMFRTFITLCLFALVPALILSINNRKIRFVNYVLPIILINSLFLPQQYISSIEKNFNGLLNNPDKTYGSLKKNGASPEIVFSKWNAFSRTDLIKIPKQPNEMILTIDGAANAPMREFDGNIENLDKYKADIGFLPFTIGSNSKTLLIGPGGGRDALYALAGGSKDITAVEINKSSIDAVKAFGGYNGNIYNRPEVKVYGEDGRSFVRKSKDKYDLISLSLVMTNTSQGMGYALSENYIYTVEAMKDYLDNLNDNGKVAFLAHDQDDFSKIIATVLQTMVNRGISVKDAPNYIALFSELMPAEHGGASMHNPIVIVKNRPFSEDESKVLMEMAKKNRISPVYVPITYEQGLMQQIKEGHISMAYYLKGFPIKVTPATDNSPYFYDFGKGIPSTLLLILFVVISGSILMFAPFASKEGNFRPTMYFALLGIGFMMVEVPLIQKFILYLGHPTLAFTFVLAALLVGGGIGGYFSSFRLFNKTVKLFYLPPIMAASINIILLLSLGFIFKNTANLNLVGRVVIASLLVMIQGFYMGMPFPRGLKLIGESGRGEIVPVMWGVNGAMSVVGSTLSIILSMSIGFTGALIAGAVIYLIVSFYTLL